MLHDGSSRPLRVAAVGLGYWGPNLARMWSSLEEVELVYICDRDEASLARTARALPDVRAITSYEHVLADPDVDAVSIATSVPTHAPLAMAAIRAGKHVFVEKPLATSVEDARALAAAADAQGVVLFVGHLLVHHPAVAKLKELSESGALGDIRYIYTNRVNLGQVRSDENALWSLGAHDVSVLLHLVGAMPESVSAQGECFIHPGVQDVVFCLLRFPGGILAHLQLSWLDPHKMRRVTVVGSEQMAVFDDMRPEQKVTVYDKGIVRPDAEPGDAWRTASYGEYVQLRFGDTHIPRVSSEEPLRIQGRHFARCVAGREVPRSGAEQGVAVVEVLEALQQSLDADGAAVEFEVPLLR